MYPLYTLCTGLAPARKAKGYTQKHVAKLLGVHEDTLSRWETGANLPDLPTLFVLADLLSTTPVDLMPSLAKKGIPDPKEPS